MKINKTYSANFEELNKHFGTYIYNTDFSGSNCEKGNNDILVTLWEHSSGDYAGSAIYAPKMSPDVNYSRTQNWEKKGEIVGEESYEDNLQRGLLCAKNNIRRYVLEYGLLRIFTFNNGGMDGGWATRQDALDDFGIFYKVHKVSLELGKMLVTAEVGANGRIHIHCLTQGFDKTGWLCYDKIGEKWSKFLTKRGYVANGDRHLFNAGHSQYPPLRAYHYFTKALEDSFRDPSLWDKHRYRVYGMVKPKPKFRFRVNTLDKAMQFCPAHACQKLLKSELNNVYGVLWRGKIK